mgnify:CR=1 FL=1|jgi:cation diffusion facilitator family transporter
MKEEQLGRWKHSHNFDQDQKRPGELRTLIVIALTTVMMILEISTGILFGSMALLADGLHMGSHAVALGINAFAYVYARRHAHNNKYSFGTGKVNTLGGYTGAVLLAIFSAIMAFESVMRLIEPVSIAFNQAIFVATLGLIVNGISVFILDAGHDHDHSHSAHNHTHHHDHNLKSAYLHVLADALTSLLAIFALLIGKYYGAVWMDPLMGIVGAVLVARWSIGLLKSTSGILLDEQAPETTLLGIRNSLEQDQNSRVVDLHVWTVAPGVYSAIISIVSTSPQDPLYYRRQLPSDIELAHITFEVQEFKLS